MLSALQNKRRQSAIEIPSLCSNQCYAMSPMINQSPPSSPKLNEISKLFPHIANQKTVIFCSKYASKDQKPLNIGVVLSGGQAPGGHNVIAGIADFLSHRPGSRLYGFLDGPWGLFSHQYLELDKGFTDNFRNLGGFHMLRSGRHKIETEEQKNSSAVICRELELDGLVVIGGDDSCTNAALLAEYFKETRCKTCVIGVPKTIDGDLRSEFLEASFGFDTAVKTYQEEIGCIISEMLATKDTWHFVRLMGRNASHITIECALETRPNVVLVGEKVSAKHYSLSTIVRKVLKVIEERRCRGKSYGIICLPEGLIEFIPEVNILVGEINKILSSTKFDTSLLTPAARETFSSLPKETQNSLVLDRDPHGNVQVSRIATEALIIDMLQGMLKARGMGLLKTKSHFLGYEGRCAMPSQFDSSYCYTLAWAACGLVAKDLSGYMAIVRRLREDPSKWDLAGLPLTSMMNIESRKGRAVPVIKKYLVDMNSEYYEKFNQERKKWRYEDAFLRPGPIQFEAPWSLRSNNTLAWSASVTKQKSNLEIYLNCHPLELEGQFFGTGHSLVTDSTGKWSVTKGDRAGQKKNVAVMMADMLSPGVPNVLIGLYQELVGSGCGTMYYLRKPADLLVPELTEVQWEDLSGHVNISGSGILGCTNYEILDQEVVLRKMVDALRKSFIDVLVICGGLRALASAQAMSRLLADGEQKKSIIFVPCSTETNLSVKINRFIGADSAIQSGAHLLGNLLTDVASAAKYYYFVKFDSHGSSSATLSSITDLCHPNLLLLSKGGISLVDLCKKATSLIEARYENNKKYGCIVLADDLVQTTTDGFALLHCLASCDPNNNSILNTLPLEAEDLWSLLSEDCRRHLASVAQTYGKKSLLGLIRTEEIVTSIINSQIKNSAAAKHYTSLTFNFSSQLSGAIPTYFDAKYALATGKVTGMLAIGDYANMCAVIEADPKQSESTWKPCPVSLNSLIMSDFKAPLVKHEHHGADNTSQALEDFYANPGPYQFL